MNKSLKQERKEASAFLKEARKLLKKHSNQIDPARVEEIQKAMLALESALEEGGPVAEAHQHLDEQVSRHLGLFRKSTAREYAESIGIAILVALFLRTFVVEPFKIPSGSMIPTLEIGDHIFVSKFSYGIWLPFVKKKLRLGTGPQRGDVIVFVYPRDKSKDFIKRVVGLPGDTVEIKDYTLYVNGKRVTQKRKRRHRYLDREENDPRWTEKTGQLYQENLFGVKHAILHEKNKLLRHRNWSSKDEVWGPKVQPGHVFVMGDNRDHSSDSREWGLVPIKNIKGRALIIWLSYGGGKGFRWRRIFHIVR